jgi:TolB-like protein/DNA-binding winged helix-turn-helix (wHTH) protein/Flp pilus assembly protein TadD
MKAGENLIYEFGEFRFDADELELYRHDERLALPQKSLEILAFLIRRRGQTVTKDELLSEIWRDAFVDENNLAVNVAALRRAFGVKATDKTFIETVSRRGYRFTANAREVAASGDFVIEKLTETRINVSETSETLEPVNKINALQTSLRRHSIALVAVFGLILGLGIFLVYSFWNSPRQKNLAPQVVPRTMAVLPLKNLSGSTETDESLSIGLTDALITKLGNIRGLAVRPTSAVLTLTAENQTPHLVGEKLNVEAVLDGKIQREGGRLRISVQLIKTADGAILWAENFDEKDADLFKIQDSISARIADALRLKVTDVEQTRLTKRQTEDLEAYKLYLRGRHAWNKRTRDGLQASIQLFQQAIDRDPTFALAFAGLADTYALLSEYNVALPIETFPKAKAAANRALEIDPNLAEAHTTLAYVLASYDWNFPEAETEYRRALELNPNYPTAHQWYGEFLTGRKRFDEAEIQFKQAVELDPLSPIAQSVLGLLYYYRHDYEAAVAQYQKTIQNHPDFPVVYAYLAFAYEKQGKLEEAFRAEFESWRRSGIDQKVLDFLEQEYHTKGHPGFLRAMIKIHEAAAQEGYYPSFWAAMNYARLGDSENTLKFLEKSFNERFRYIVYIGGEPIFDEMRDDPRFQDLIRRIGLEN